MQFKEAYKEIMLGKKITNSTGLFVPPENKKISFLAAITPRYFIGDVMVKQDQNVMVGIDEQGALHQINAASMVNMLLADDDSWTEYVEQILPTQEPEVLSC